MLSENEIPTQRHNIQAEMPNKILFPRHPGAKQPGGSEDIEKNILFNLCGHGHFYVSSYQDYFDGKQKDHYFTDEELHVGINKFDTLTI